MSDWSKPQSRLFSVYSPWWITFYVRLIAFACTFYTFTPTSSHHFVKPCPLMSIANRCKENHALDNCSQSQLLQAETPATRGDVEVQKGSFLTVLYGFMCGLCQHIIVLHKVADPELLQFLDVFAWQRCLGMPAPFPCGLKVFIIIYT